MFFRRLVIFVGILGIGCLLNQLGVHLLVPVHARHYPLFGVRLDICGLLTVLTATLHSFSTDILFHNYII